MEHSNFNYKKSYYEIIKDILNNSNEPLTTKEIYKKALDSGFRHKSDKSNILRIFRKVLNKYACYTITDRGKLWFLCDQKNYNKVNNYKEDNLYNIELMIKVIENLIENKDVPENIDINNLIGSLNSYKLGIQAKKCYFFDIEKFNCGMKGVIPDDWNDFYKITKAVLENYNKIPLEIKEICKICN